MIQLLSYFVFGKFERLTKTSGLNFSFCILGSLLDYHSCMLDHCVLTINFYPIFILAKCQTKVYEIVVLSCNTLQVNYLSM